MGKKLSKLLLLLVVFSCEGAGIQKQHEALQTTEKKGQKKEGVKKKEKKGTVKEKKKKEITPYEVAENISKAINWISNPTNSFAMADAEPKILKRRKIALNLYKAEAFCLLTLADYIFASTRGKNIRTLLNWPDIHPLLGKDTYAEVQKFSDINFDYHNDTSLKAPQSEIVRDKLREGLHENVFSIIDLLNTITNGLPGGFYYSGHPYEGIAAFDHVLLYQLLATGEKTSLSSSEACFHLWQVALYKNFYFMTKLIAERVLTYKGLDPDMRDLVKQIAIREPGDDTLDLPTCGLS